MAIGAWSELGFVKNVDINSALGNEIQGPEEQNLQVDPAGLLTLLTLHTLDPYPNQTLTLQEG